jgi:hypothetical protein
MLGDLFSSSKGPGLIGLLLGLFVPAGFCGLGFAVFDGRLNGEIASRKKKELNQDAQNILLLKDQIVRSDGLMDGRKKRKAYARKLGVTKRGIDLRKIRLAEITSEVDGENWKITALKEEKKVYMQHYRKVAADRMVGRVVTKLTTSDGKIYYNVEITKVSGLEMSFKHKNGVGNVKLAVLEDALQDTLQFSVESARSSAAVSLALLRSLRFHDDALVGGLRRRLALSPALLVFEFLEHTLAKIRGLSQGCSHCAQGPEGRPGDVVLHAFHVAVDGILIDLEEAQELSEQFMPIDNGLGDALTFVGEDGAAVFLVFDESLGVEALQHIGHAGLRNPEALGDVNRPCIAFLLNQMQNLLEVVVHRDGTAGT